MSDYDSYSCGGMSMAGSDSNSPRVSIRSIETNNYGGGCTINSVSSDIDRYPTENYVTSVHHTEVHHNNYRTRMRGNQTFVSSSNRISSVRMKILFVVVCFVVFAGIAIVLSSGSDSTRNDYTKPPSEIPNVVLPSDSNYEENGIKFVSRCDWEAKPPKKQLNDLELPSQRVIIAHTVTANCSTQTACKSRVRSIQAYHQSKTLSDISYNFLVGGDGSVYEGRGWDKVGAHTKDFNLGSIGFAFIGNFSKELPPIKQRNAAQKMIAYGVKIRKLDRRYKLYGQRQFGKTESPGDSLYAEIQKWINWSMQMK